MTIHVQITLTEEHVSLLGPIGNILSQGAAPITVSKVEPEKLTEKKARKLLSEVETDSDGDSGDDEAPAPAPAKRKPGRPAKVAIVEPESEDEDDAAEEPSEDDAAEDEDEAPKRRPGRPPAKGKLTLSGDIIPACKAHKAKYGHDKTAAVLKKFGVKSPQDLSEDQYADLIKALKV
jgi:hypothetical protein